MDERETFQAETKSARAVPEAIQAMHIALHSNENVTGVSKWATTRGHIDQRNILKEGGITAQNFQRD